MPRKEILYLLLLLLLSIIVWYLSHNQESTIIDDNNFSISDTASINRIFMADRIGESIMLDRHKEMWMVNNKYEVRKDAITTILNTIRQIRIQRPVPKESFEGVIKNLATTGVKVEIYNDQEESPIRSYTIGTSTPNHLGTYMLLDGAKSPFIVHIPSFNGFLSPRYGIQGQRLDEKKWRATNVFSFKMENIISVTINNKLKPEQSFNLNTQPMKLFDYSGKEVHFKEDKVLEFLNSFRNLNCESFKSENMLESSIPLHELIINNDTLRTYSFDIKNIKKENTQNYNVKRMYAKLNNGELMVIQDYVFNKVLITINQLQ